MVLWDTTLKTANKKMGDLKIYPDLDREFLKTLLRMWDNPKKRMLLIQDGVTESMIADAREKFFSLKDEKQ